MLLGASFCCHGPTDDRPLIPATTLESTTNSAIAATAYGVQIGNCIFGRSPDDNRVYPGEVLGIRRLSCCHGCRRNAWTTVSQQRRLSRFFVAEQVHVSTYSFGLQRSMLLRVENLSFSRSRGAVPLPVRAVTHRQTADRSVSFVRLCI